MGAQDRLDNLLADIGKDLYSLETLPSGGLESLGSVFFLWHEYDDNTTRLGIRVAGNHDGNRQNDRLFVTRRAIHSGQWCLGEHH